MAEEHSPVVTIDYADLESGELSEQIERGNNSMEKKGEKKS